MSSDMPSEVASLDDYVGQILTWPQQDQDAYLATLDDDSVFKIYDAMRRARIQHNPVGWIEETFKTKLWEGQQEIVRSVISEPDTEDVYVASCHGAGKTYTAALVGLTFLNAFEYSCVLTTAPTFRQVKHVLWQELRSAHAMAGLPGEPNLTELKITDKWYALGFSVNDANAFQGHHSNHMLVIFDEACGIEKIIWDGAEGVLSTGHARGLRIGNPTDMNTEFFKGCKSSLPSNKRYTISAFDTPNFTQYGITQQDIEDDTWADKIAGRPLPRPYLVTPSWVSKRYKAWGKGSPLYRARVLGLFPESGDDTLISLAHIERASALEMKRDTRHIEFGQDVAYFGNDENVLAMRIGGYVRIIGRWHGQDTVDSAKSCIYYIKKANIDYDLNLTEAQLKKLPIKVDVIGYGAGVADNLIDWGWGGVRVNVADGALDPEKYKNWRAECFWGLRDRFWEGTIDIDPEDEELQLQLSMIRYKIPGGRIQILEKAEIKKELGRSPDDVDAVVLAFAPNKEIDVVASFGGGNDNDLTKSSMWGNI